MWEKKKEMWISKHTPAQELQVSLILFSPLSSVCSLTERSALLAHWEICKDNEKSREDGRLCTKMRAFRTACPANVVVTVKIYNLSFSCPVIYSRIHMQMESLLC